MARKNNKNKELKTIYLIGGILLIIMLAINLIPNKKDQIIEEEISNQENIEEVRDIANENITATLKQMEERDRMEFYFGMFLDYIESGDYDKAYDLLYSEFKQNYFPTLESFKEYAQKTFPEFATIEHENIERNGDVYVLWVYISDAVNGKPGEDKKEMNFVIKENDYNDFVMSFSAE